MDQLCTKTTVAISEEFQEDRIWLNGKEESVHNPRIQNCLKEFRKIILEREGKHCPLVSCKVHICSENDFPTAAGLASSAAGYACLVYSLSAAFGLKNIELSSIARQGSGSACRSLSGGFVQWDMGESDNGSDSVARQLFSEDHWPQLRVLVLVVNDSQKETSSTGGMERSVETSSLLPLRCKNILPSRIQQITEAIKDKDFGQFAEITMKDSNQFHAVCQDTYPPLRYMNDLSWAIVDLVHKFNKFYGSNKVAYTFDAGPNACLFALESDVDEVVSAVRTGFPPSNEKLSEEFCVGLPVGSKALSSELQASLNMTPKIGAIKYVIHTRVGGGPQLINNHLLNEDGLPKKTRKN